MAEAVQLTYGYPTGCGSTSFTIPAAQQCHTNTVCTTQPSARMYLEPTTCAPIQQTTCVTAPLAPIYRPQTIQIHMPAAPVEEKVPCECFESIELSDDERVIEPTPLPERIEIGAPKEELDLIKGEIDNLTISLQDLMEMFKSNNDQVQKNFMVVERNMKVLDERLTENEKKTSINTVAIKLLRRDMDLM